MVPMRGVAAVQVPRERLLRSVALVAAPVMVAQVRRPMALASGGSDGLDRLLALLGPVSLVALRATLILLFGFQGAQILRQPLAIALIRPAPCSRAAASGDRKRQGAIFQRMT